MEYAPLRPVPVAPPTPVDPERAARHVSALLPRLPEVQAKALALVVLAGRTRAEAARDAGVEEGELGRALGFARSALRRSLVPLEGSGWCRRAEGLVSDRLDDALDARGVARLEVHLRNCPRCVEHERRLVQAQNGLVSAFGREPANGEPADLSLVPPAEPRQPEAAPVPGALVAVTVGALLVLSALLVIAAIAFAVAAIVG